MSSPQPPSKSSFSNKNPRRSFTKEEHTATLGYSQKVRYLKKALPLLAFAVVAVVVIWPKVEDMLTFEAEDLETTNAPLKVSMSNQLINPRLKSIDEKGRPYAVKAKVAEQVNPEQAELTKPESEIEIDGKKIRITSDKGDFNEEKNTLDYTGDVTLEIDDHRFSTEAAQLDYGKRQAGGCTPVTGEGPMGQVHSEKGFELDSEGCLTFKGRTKLVLKPRKQ